MVKLAAFLESFFYRRETSLSDLASLRGRVQHYSICLPHSLPGLPFAALISSVMGTETAPDYNTVVLLPPAINDAAVFLRESWQLTGNLGWRSGPSSPAPFTKLSLLAKPALHTL
jgi:hypothetical protein